MAAYTHPTVDAEVQSLTDWVDRYNVLITDINASGLRLGASLVGNGTPSTLTIANTDFIVGNSTANVVLYGNGHAYISGDLTVAGTVVGATVTVPLANTTANGLVSITTQSFAGNKTFTGTVTASSFIGSLTGTANNATNLNGQAASYYTNASNLSTGTVPSGRLSGTYAITANNATNLNGQASSYYTNASNLSSGTVPSGRLTGTYDISITGDAATVGGVTMNIGALIGSSPAALLGSNGTTILRYDSTSVTVGAASVANSVNGNLNSPLWAKMGVQGAVDGGATRGIYLWNVSDTNWAIYMSTNAANTGLSGTAAAPTPLSGASSHHVRFRAASTSGYGFNWENSANTSLMSLDADTGNLWTKSVLVTGDNRVRVGPNSGWSKYLYLGGNDRASSSHAAIHSTNGNLHLDSADGTVLYLNYYSTQPVYVNGALYPVGDNIHRLGTAGARWDEIYAGLPLDTTDAETKTGQLVAGASGRLYYVSSTRRNKTNIVALETEFDPLRWLDVEPRVYNLKVAPTGPKAIGFIAEELHDLGLTGVVCYDADGEPTSVRYDLATVYLTALVKQHHARIAALEAAVASLS